MKPLRLKPCFSAILLFVLLVLLQNSVCAQYVSPLPNNESKAEIDSLYKEQVTDSLNGQKVRLESEIKSLDRLLYANEWKEKTDSLKQTVLDIQRDDTLDTSLKDIEKKWLFKGPLLRAVDFKKLYGDASKFSFLNFINGSISKDRAIITNEVLSGIGGQFKVSLSTAFVVNSINEDTASKREEIQDKSAAVTRMILSGGSWSMKFIRPIIVGGGTTWKHASSAYINAGLFNGISDVTNNQEGVFCLGVTGEYMGNLAVRDPSTFDVVFDFILGFRVSHFWLTRDHLGFTGWKEKAKGRSSGQISFGIRQKGNIKHTIVYTFAHDDFKGYYPRFFFNIQASPF
ncbi:MAG: hypothetical protein KAR42_11505 [candidate division Zixibacteria bacterium]|nr:hypothetical protein [candidate division Zixibacteria bacterium]